MPTPVHNYDVEKLLNCEKVSNRAKEALRVLIKDGTIVGTAKTLGISRRALQRLLSRANSVCLEEEVQELIPNNQLLSGTSTLYKVDEETGEKSEVLQWVKTKTSKDLEYEAIVEVTNELAKEVEGKAKPIPLCSSTEDDLLVTYVSTDLHLGQYSYAEETGDEVTIDTIYNNTLTALSILQSTTPNASTAIVLDLGDTLHAANDAARTKSGHELDTDGRHAKIFKKLVDLKIKMVELALQKHEKVRYVVVAGNHSDLVPNYLTAMLAAYFRNEPRFEVDESPALHKYYRHGETLLGFHHGHATKMRRLPEVMVWDRKEDISSTTYRYWLTGHIHSDKVLDSPIARCEAFRNNTPNDAWATGVGFRNHKQTVAITYHKKYGEIARNICPIQEVKDKGNI